MELWKKYKLFFPPITNNPDTNIPVSGMIPQSKGDSTIMAGELIVRAGTILPNNDATAQFVVNDTYIVTEGDASGSLIKSGYVLKQRLPEEPTAEAIASLAKHGVFVEDADETSRPNFGEVKDLTPIEKPVLVNDAGAKKFTWAAVTNAKAYLVYANSRVVKTIFASGTREYVYGTINIATDFNVKAIGNNLTHGNSELSDTITVKPESATATEGGTK